MITTFLKSVLGDIGHYCIVAIKGERRAQSFYDTVDDAVEAATRADQNGFDAYYALATFTDDKSRTIANALQLRSFFLDLDCGATKDYPTQSEAIADLQRFVKTLGLPKPKLVNSGRGIHAYWSLTAPVAKADWLPVATRLKALCKEHDLLADVAVTADCARILRVPGTHNYKDNPPKEVSLLRSGGESVEFDSFKKLLGEGALPTTTALATTGSSAIAEAIKGNYTNKFKNIMVKTMNGSGCEQLNIAATKQAQVSEPQWRAALSIAAFCEDSEKAIHIISSRHPNYSASETATKAANIKGPYTCTVFDEFNAGVCPYCKHWGNIKSPIILGREVVEATEQDNIVTVPAQFMDEAIDEDGNITQLPYVIPQYPTPFLRGKQGGIYKRVKTEDGEIQAMIYQHDLYVVKRTRDPEQGEVVVMRLHLPHDGVREFSMPLSSVTTKDEFRKILAMNGVALVKVDDLMAYVTQWVNDLQMKTVAEEAHRQFGWTAAAESFVLGDREYFPARDVHNPVSAATRELYTAFTPKGTLDGWKTNMEFYNRPGFEAYQWLVGGSFGSILTEFTPINAAGFHMYSKDSGLGKTTAMYAAASVWGDPMRLVFGERDTDNSIMNRAEVLKNLPLFFDENTNKHPKSLSDNTYQICSGKQRNRMSSKSNVERYRGMAWKLLWASNGNTDILERISLYKAMPKAEAMRMVSHRVKRIKFASKNETDVFSAAVQDHYGWAGPIFVRYVVAHKEEVVSLLHTIQQRLDRAAGLSAEHRFWSIDATNRLGGLVIANNLGLLRYDTRQLFKWAVNMLVAERVRAEEILEDPLTILGDYLSENVNSVLRIKSTTDARKRSVEEQVNPEATPRGQSIIGRYEYDLKKMYIVIKPFKEWCIKRQIHFQSMYDALKDAHGAEREKCRIGRGTHLNLPPLDVLCMPFEFGPEPTDEEDNG